MATNPAYRVPDLTCTVETRDNGETVVLCSGRIVTDTTETLKRTVKPLIVGDTKNLVLDFSNVTYLDSSGLGALISLYVSARTARCQFTAVNLNARVKELFSLTRLGEVLTSGRDPNHSGIYYSGI